MFCTQTKETVSMQEEFGQGKEATVALALMFDFLLLSIEECDNSHVICCLKVRVYCKRFLKFKLHEIK